MTTTFTDEMMREQMAQAVVYTLVVLRPTDKYGSAGTDKIIWEHAAANGPAGRRRSADRLLPRLACILAATTCVGSAAPGAWSDRTCHGA